MEENKMSDDSKEEVLSLKSIDEKDSNNNIIDIIEKSNKNRILLTSTKAHLRIDIKSLKKIFSYFTEKDQLSDMYLDHITMLFNIAPKKKKEYKKSETINNTNDEMIELDDKYKTILEKATIFHINLEKNFDNENEDNDKKIQTQLLRQMSVDNR